MRAKITKWWYIKIKSAAMLLHRRLVSKNFFAEFSEKLLLNKVYATFSCSVIFVRRFVGEESGMSESEAGVSESRFVQKGLKR